MLDGPTISNLPEGQNLTVSKVEINVPAHSATPGSTLVKVLINYPADWKKDKFFKDGDVKEVSPEIAETFVEIGIATIVDTEEEVTTEDVQASTEGKKKRSKSDKGK